MEDNQNNYPQGVTPPQKDAVMVLGTDGKYYWMIPTAAQPVVSQPQTQSPVSTFSPQVPIQQPVQPQQFVNPSAQQPVVPVQQTQPSQPVQQTPPPVRQQTNPQPVSPIQQPVQPQQFVNPPAQQPFYTVQSNPIAYQPSYIQPVVTIKPPIPYGYTEKTYNERKEIRRQALSIGFAFLSITLVPFILEFLIRNVLSNVLGSDSFISENILSGPIYNEILQILFSTVAFTVPFIIFAKSIGKQQLAEITGFTKSKKGLALPMFLFGIAFCGFAQVASDVLSDFFSRFFTYEVPQYEGADGVTGIILSIISTAIAPALFEEFACRGVVLGSLRKYGDGLALFVSSLLFGAMHGNFQQIPFAFLVGLVLGYIRIKSDSIWICCAVHSFNNALSVLYSELQKNLLTDSQTETFYVIVITVSMLLGFVALFITDNVKDIFKLEKSSLECSGKQKFKWFFTSPVIIIFLAESLFESAVFLLPSNFLNLS